jgi:hypothetical protein
MQRVGKTPGYTGCAALLSCGVLSLPPPAGAKAGAPLRRSAAKTRFDFRRARRCDIIYVYRTPTMPAPMPNDETRNRRVNGIPNLMADFDPEVLTQEVIRLGEEWADKDAAASALEETRKTLLSQIITGLMAPTPGSKPMSLSLAEVRALADKRYEAHVDLMVASRKEANKARVRYDMGKMRLELLRSLQATMRQEMMMNRG